MSDRLPFEHEDLGLPSVSPLGEMGAFEAFLDSTLKMGRIRRMNGERQVNPPVEHILMTYATRLPYRAIPDMPARASYDFSKGYWLKDGMPMVALEEFTEGCFGSKKRDLETGEDLKGE